MAADAYPSRYLGTSRRRSRSAYLKRIRNIKACDRVRMLTRRSELDPAAAEDKDIDA